MVISQLHGTSFAMFSNWEMFTLPCPSVVDVKHLNGRNHPFRRFSSSFGIMEVSSLFSDDATAFDSVSSLKWTEITNNNFSNISSFYLDWGTYQDIRNPDERTKQCFITLMYLAVLGQEFRSLQEVDRLLGYLKSAYQL